LRPAKELKGFEKVTLAPGEQQRVTLTLTADAFRYFDVNTHSWVDDPGDYRLMVGTSSVDIRLSETIRR
jgi:beta-glucosidase